MELSLLIILTVNVFLIGVGATVAGRYAWLHFHPHPEVKHARAAEKAVRLSAKTREELIKEAEATYRAVLEKTTLQLVGDLEKTTARLNSSLSNLGDKIINDEISKFQKGLEQIQANVATTSAKGVADITLLADEMKQKMQAEVEHEKEQLLAQVDTKLADSVVAFLLETLQHEVDLGAQTAYLTKQLEEHKDEFSGAIKNGS